ncbi:MAG TPA: asparagine synthase-related protein [Stellaceae bacterium]|nr:asparagine synthase-related protein [Stellaceae bacterium]
MSRRSPGALFVYCPDAPGGHDPQPIAREREGLFAALAHLDNRDELGAALQIPTPELARTSDAALFMRIVENWGERGVARCLGGFVFARWDADTRTLTLGRDCLGISRTLFFYRGGDFVVFASTLVALLSLPFVPREIDEVSLANFMITNMREARRTVYRGVERVPSRTMITFDRAGIRHAHYWSPDLTSVRFRREEDYVERARELFDQAVLTATAGSRHVAISTSGGLDSSAIAATAARLGRAERITCYTLVPPPGAADDARPWEYPDEREKVAALGRMYPSLDIRLLAPEAPHAFEEDDTRYFAKMGFPIHSGGVNLGWFSYLYDAVAVDGHRALVEGRFGNWGLTWDGSFFLLALLLRGDWRTLVRELPIEAAERGRGLAHTLAAQALIWNVPVPLRRLLHRLRGRDTGSVAHYSALNPSFIAECDLPRLWRNTGFDPWSRPSVWNPARFRASKLFDSNQVARDLYAQTEDQYGFATRDAHADRRLLEFALSVPEPLYHRGGVPRSFARAVFADRLPREILDERRRGAQGGAWFRRMDVRRQDIAREVERLEASPLARRMIDLPRLKRLVDEWPTDEQAAIARRGDYRVVLARGIHFGRFIRWVEGGNA